MPVPASSNDLTLGRGAFDPQTIETMDDVRSALTGVYQVLVGMGWPGPKTAGSDNVYMGTFAQSDGMGAHRLYGGNPRDPVNPTLLVLSASGSATVDWFEETSLVVSSGVAKFVGGLVTVTTTGGNAIITLAMAAGTYIDVNNATGEISVDLTEVSGYDAGQPQYLKNDSGTIKWVTATTCS